MCISTHGIPLKMIPRPRRPCSYVTRIGPSRPLSWMTSARARDRHFPKCLLVILLLPAMPSSIRRCLPLYLLHPGYASPTLVQNASVSHVHFLGHLAYFIMFSLTYSQYYHPSLQSCPTQCPRRGATGRLQTVHTAVRIARATRTRLRQ